MRIWAGYALSHLLPSTYRWTRQRERLEQLTLQAVMNAMQQTDEFVKEYLVSHEKVLYTPLSPPLSPLLHAPPLHR